MIIIYAIFLSSFKCKRENVERLVILIVRLLIEHVLIIHSLMHKQQRI